MLLPIVPVSVDFTVRPHRLSTLPDETNMSHFPERTLNCLANLSTSDNMDRPSVQILFHAEERASRSGDLSLNFADRRFCTHKLGIQDFRRKPWIEEYLARFVEFL